MPSVPSPRLTVTIAGLFALCAMGSVLGTAAEPQPDPQQAPARPWALPATVDFNQPVGGFTVATRR